jgi:hypothetical protein
MVDEHMDSGDLRARVVALENWRVLRDIDSARHDEKWKRMDEKIGDMSKQMEDKIDSVDGKVDKISSDLSRIMWLILSGIILAIVAYLVKGGFAS